MVYGFFIIVVKAIKKKIRKRYVKAPAWTYLIEMAFYRWVFSSLLFMRMMSITRAKLGSKHNSHTN